MPRRFTIAFAVLLLGLAPALSPRAQDKALDPDSTLAGVLDRGRLRVCFEAGYLPFEMIGTRSGLRERSLRSADERKGGQTTRFGGFDIDLAREMARELGVDFVPVNTRWTSIIPSLTLGRCDIIISGMSVTEWRRRKVDFSEPYMQVGQTVLLNAELAAQVTAYVDLNDPRYKVASKPGTTGEDAVRRLLPQADYRPFESELEAAEAVAEGKVDALVYDRPFNATFLAMRGGEGLVFLDEPFTEEAIAFAIRKEDPDFLAWLNGFLEKVRADGRYERLRRKWFESTEWFDLYR
ncbi:MAG: transporter substrate-binding domain-containing protein [Kiloniellales bacterium]|nr:transporter substrate-binding domain-containing protein [Kiloniellales bacterium]